MTHEEWIKLTPEEQRIKVAECVGWTRIHRDYDWFDGEYSRSALVGLPPTATWVGSSSLREVPNYIEDLNAMHAAYVALPPLKQHAFKCRLGRMFEEQTQDQLVGGYDVDYGYFDAQCATAAQRAEAFVLTMEGT